MNHVEAMVAAPYFAETAQASPLGKLFHLRDAKMKETQRNSPGSIRNYYCQCRAPAAHDGGVLNLPFDQCACAGIKRTDWVNPGPVLVSERKMKEQILGCVDPQGV
jgi:hypothetical protein